MLEIRYNKRKLFVNFGKLFLTFFEKNLIEGNEQNEMAC